MKTLATVLLYSLSALVCAAETSDQKIQSFFGETHVTLQPYNNELKQITVNSKTYFASADGKYLFAGPVYDLAVQQDLVATIENRQRLERISQLPREGTLSYPAADEAKHEVTVFTEIEYPFCRKMHNHMQAFNEQGITVNYVMLPRAGIGSPSYQKAVAAFCAENPAESLTQDMNGAELPPETCDNTVKEQFELAQEPGIRAATVLPSGKLQLGLMSPEQLLSLINNP